MAGVNETTSLAGAEAAISRDAGRRLDAVFRSGAGIFSILVLLIAWETFARSGKVTPFMLPPFSAVAERIYADAIAGDLWRNLAVTLFRALTGFAIAAVGGVALGAMMARSRIDCRKSSPACRWRCRSRSSLPSSRRWRWAATAWAAR